MNEEEIKEAKKRLYELSKEMMKDWQPSKENIEGFQNAIDKLLMEKILNEHNNE